MMITRKRLLGDRKAYEEKAAGAFIGLAVGDAMGDLGRNQEYRARYGIVTNLYPDARSTDDTEFAVLTARAILDAKGSPKCGDFAKAWRRYVLERGGAKKRAGRPLYGALENLARGLNPPLSGKFNVLNTDDGAAMRSAPHGIYLAGDPGAAADSAEEDAVVSHDCDGVWAARAVAASVSAAIAGGSVEEVVRVGVRELRPGSWIADSMSRAMRICEEKSSIEAAYEALHVELWTPEHASSAEAIPQAYAIYRLTGGDFGKAVLWSANFGRDADTISSLVLSMVGAMRGIGTIPAPWVERVRKASGVCLEFALEEDILQLSEALVGLSYAKGR